MRVSLKDLFAVTGFGAVMAWCAGEARIDNGLFWMLLGVSAAMCVVFVLIAKNKQGRWLTLLIPPGAFFFCFFPMASSALLYMLALLFVAGMVCAVLPPLGLRALTGMMMACLMVAFVAAVHAGKTELRRLEAMRQQFPVVSLASRLAYEKRASIAGAETQTPAMTPVVARSLADFESELHDDSRREWGLRMIHERQHELFIRASGFGVGRMVRRPKMRWIEMPPLRDLPFDGLAVREGEIYNHWSAAWRQGRAVELEQLHRASRNDFLDAAGFGLVVSPLVQVAGFIEHALHVPPAAHLEDQAAWTIARLELVSLLKFNGPRVYVLDHLPRMDQLAENDAPTRALDEFETAAISKLQTDEDVVIAEGASDVRMLGSLRAGYQCLDCHSVPRGALLGAFSYVLRRGDALGEAAKTTALAAFGGEFTTEDTEGTELE